MLPILIVAGVAVPLSPVAAEERAALVHAPMSAPPPAPKLALLFALKVRLPEGRGLAAQLIQSGVDQDDAAAAARIAAGHLGDGVGGCQAKIEISRPIGAASFRLERVELTTDERRAVIERRAGGLSLASDTGLSRRSPII